MKNLKLLSFLMILASSLMFIQCTSDPIAGPQGFPGIDGYVGEDGEDGVAGTATCVSCHNKTHRKPIEDSFPLSKHSTGKTRDGRCAACHSQEGYFAALKGTFNELDYPSGTVLTKKTCTTCHNKHSTFDFENDGYDFALRSFGPVELNQMPGVTIDFNNTSNMCVQCHQPRDAEPSFEADGTYIVTSENNGIGPHYGVNATFMKGIQGYAITGDVAIPGAGDNPHSVLSCTKCHMGDPNTNSQEGFGYDDNGSHTFNPTLNTCIKCHDGLTTFDRNGFQTEILALEEQLKDLMFAKNMAVMGSRRPELITGQVLPKAYVEIFWNYASATSDHSHGIHNPPYTEAMLKNAIQKLNSLPAIP
ncbi:cytochrome c3 family protein [Lutibacter sp.]|uniref:cytochrome c3 family protein n=1 Tax=Lutibacter sp. TaxID=1925666 RepID=UPI00356983EE